MASTDVFESQDGEYQQQVLTESVQARVAVEAGHPDYWCKWVGREGRILGINRFGESAPGKVLMNEFGFTSERIIEEVLDLLG